MTIHMKAVMNKEYGSPAVLQVADIEKPAPKDHEVLIKIQATAVSSGDCRLRRADPFAVRFFFGLFKPKKKVLGDALSGIVEAVGKGVTKFNIGDEVFGTTGLAFGAYAEYICLPETGVLAEKPQNISHEAAAAVPFGAATALHFVRLANIQPGQKVLIYGASGAVGSAAVQLARYFGAEVTAVCSTANVALMQSLGAEQVMDYTQGGFAPQPGAFDVVFETVGKASFDVCLAALKPNGTLILGAGMLPEMIRGAWTSMTTNKKVLAGVAIAKTADIEWLQKLLETGAFKPVVDRSYPLEQMAMAHEYVEKGHKKGNVVIRVG